MNPEFSRLDMQTFILDKLKLYSSMPSLTGKEEKFLNFLVSDFHKDGDLNKWRKVYLDNNPYYYYRNGGKAETSILPYFLVVHTDRVPNYNASKDTAYVDTISRTVEFLTGQLDNIIGISIARYLIEKDIPIDILFTTREETVESTLQLWEMCKLNGKTPITIDIDVFNDIDKVRKGQTTLRFEDRNGQMLTSLVKTLQKVAVDNEIPFSFNEGEAIVETGFLSKIDNGKYKGAHVGIPLINYHSDMETTTWECVYNTILVLFNFFTQSIKEGA